MGPARFLRAMERDPDAQLLDEAVLAISAALQPGIDDIEWLARLDELAGDCPTPTAEGIARFLCDQVGFSGNRSVYYDWRNSCLDRVIATRAGIPITLSVLMMEIGRRLGVKLVGVGLPAHFVVADPSSATYFDPFNGRQPLDAEQVRELFATVTRGQVAWSDQYLEPTPHRAILIRMLNNLKSILAGRGDRIRYANVMVMRTAFEEIAGHESDELISALAAFN